MTETLYVVLDEPAVIKSFLSEKVKLFNIAKFSTFYRWDFSKIQSNEYVIEGFISMADNQSFDNQNDETLENRLIIKTKSDTFASTREVSQQIDEMSVTGHDGWDMHKLTLPITYGRYHNQQSLVFKTMKSKKSSKHSYIFRMMESSYQAQIDQIANNYK